MTAVHVTCVVQITHPPAVPAEEFHERGAALMDQLISLEESDPDIADVELLGDLGEMTWTIEMLVRTDDQFEALLKALGLIRTALHALGGSTAGWPSGEEAKSVFRPSVADVELVPA